MALNMARMILEGWDMADRALPMELTDTILKFML
jgi:hypothetical protein